MSVARTKKPKYAHKWHHNTNKASQREETFQQTVIWSVQFLSFLNNCFKTVKGINPSDSASLFSLARNYPAYTSWFVQALDASPLSALSIQDKSYTPAHLSWAGLSLLWLLTQHPGMPQVSVSEASERRSYLEIYSLLICCVWNAEPLGPIRTAGNIHPVPD